MKTGWLIYLTALLLSSCKADSPPPDCGCGSETINTVPSQNLPDIPTEEQMSGILFHNQALPNFKFGRITPNNEGDFEKYKNRFWLYQEDEEYELLRYFALCPNHSLPDEFQEVKNSADSIRIRYTGKIKNLCDPVIAFGVVPKNYLITEMEIASIETQ